MGNKPFLLKLYVGDKVYLKHNFKKHFTKDMNLIYRSQDMDILQGKQVVITAILHTYMGKMEFDTFVCVPIEQFSRKAVRLPLICIDRTQPLTRDGKKFSLRNHKLYLINISKNE